MYFAVYSRNVDLDFFTMDLNEDNGDKKESTVLYNTFDISYTRLFWTRNINIFVEEIT